MGISPKNWTVPLHEQRQQDVKSLSKPYRSSETSPGKYTKPTLSLFPNRSKLHFAVVCSFWKSSSNFYPSISAGACGIFSGSGGASALTAGCRSSELAISTAPGCNWLWLYCGAGPGCGGG